MADLLVRGAVVREVHGPQAHGARRLWRVHEVCWTDRELLARAWQTHPVGNDLPVGRPSILAFPDTVEQHVGHQRRRPEPIAIDPNTWPEHQKQIGTTEDGETQKSHPWRSRS